MGASSFRAGQLLTLEGVRFQLTRRIDQHTWQLQTTRDGRYIERTSKELLQAYANRVLVMHNDAEPITTIGPTYCEPAPEQMELAKIRRMYVVAVLDYPGNASLLDPIIERVWQKMKSPATRPSARTVLRWRAAYLQYGRDVRALVPRDEKKGNRSCRFETAVVEIVDKAIDEIYMNDKKGTIIETTEHAVTLIAQENRQRPSSMQLPLPTESTIKRQIRKIPAYERSVARDGYMNARRKFRAVMNHRLTNAPLERAEIDHTLLDVFVIDEQRGLPLGRPWLTVCIDDNTRNILGIHIGFQSPSYITVAKCLRHAFMPKLDLLEKYPDIHNEWEAFGIMQELSMDNGLEFHSIALENACLGLGIEMHYAPRKTPWFKGKVERIIGTLQKDLIHKISGTTFSNIVERGDYDPQKHAVITLSTLKHAVHKWIADVYHAKPHRSLQARPIDIWRSRVNIDEIRMPDDPTYLDAVLGKPIENCLLSHKGIEHERQYYNSPELTALRHELGDTLRVEIRVDDSDMGKIIVLAPDKTNRMFVVPALNQEYAAGLTLWQHKVIRRYAAEYMNTLDPLKWLEAKEELRALVAEEFVLKSGKGRLAGAIFLGESDMPKPKTAKNKSKPKEASPPAAPPAPMSASTPPSSQPSAPVKSMYEPVISNRSVDYA